MKSGWMDWCGTDVADILDLKNLEELFGQDSDVKPKTPGNLLYLNFSSATYVRLLILLLS